MLTVPEAAARAGLAAETIRRWIRAGRLPSLKVGTQHLVDEEDLEAALRGERLPGRSRGRGVAEAPEAYPSARPAWENRIALDPRVLAGKPLLKGTRIAVELIVELLAAGWSEPEILDNYPGLTGDDLRACLAYAAERLRAERVYPRPAPL
ncbi:MAG: DUF433 domain-containing protein [Acidobacteria bacterium]|nr:DUF433 domain-containing protein [Acidobacteriota bacterium]